MKIFIRPALIVLALIQTAAVSQAEDRTSLAGVSVSANRAKNLGERAVQIARSSTATALDRVAYAVDGAESSHGQDLAMWGPDPSGPQGPMQVTDAAAADVGGGDRFDIIQNRAIGRDYLALLYRRYKNWPDAIVAYNWGMGNLDAWVKAGRPADKFLTGVAAYLRRVLYDSGMCDGAMPVRQTRKATAEEEGLEGAAFARTVCADLDAWVREGDRHFLAQPGRFHDKLEKALLLAAQHLPAPQRATPDRNDHAIAVRISDFSGHDMGGFRTLVHISKLEISRIAARADTYPSSDPPNMRTIRNMRRSPPSTNLQ